MPAIADPSARSGSFANTDWSSRELLSQEADRMAYPWPDAAADKAAKHSWYEEYQDVKETVQRSQRREKRKRQNYSWIDYAALALPCITWLRTYNVREYLMYDLMAGIAVAFTVVPQGMSYAGIAGLPAVYGLYGAFTPLLVYAVFGSCRQLGVGPVAVTSTLIASGLASLVPGYSAIKDHNDVPASQQPIQDAYNTAVIQVAFLVAVLYTAVGVLRLGWVIRFLSHAVITGFTSGTALIIASGQLKYLFGVTYARQTTLHGELGGLVGAVKDAGFAWPEFVMGCCMIVLLVTLRTVGNRYPKLFMLKALGPFLACVIGIVVVVTTGNSSGSGNIKIVKNIPSGMPHVTIGQWVPVENAGTVLPVALLVMAVDLLESTSIARALARKNGYSLAFNQEIVALGIANFFGAAFGSYTTTGSFSRSAINNSCGAKTQLSGFITGMIVMLVLLFATPIFRLMPYNAMAAIIIVGVLQLVEVGIALELFRVHVRDFLVWMVAFFCTCFLGVELGLLAAITLSLLLIIFESAFPHTAVLGRLPKTTAYRSLQNFPNSEVIPGILVMRLDAPLYFANSMHFEEKIEEYLEEADDMSRDAGVDRIYYVVFEMNAVTHIDSQGAHTILDIAKTLRDVHDVQLLLSNPNRRVARVLDRMHMERSLPKDMVFGRCYDAVGFCRARLAERFDMEASIQRSQSLTLERARLSKGEDVMMDTIIHARAPADEDARSAGTPVDGVALDMVEPRGERKIQ